MNKTVALAVVVAAFLSGSALAQTAPQTAMPQATAPERAAQAKGSATDFVRHAANGGAFEVESSRLALDKSKRDPVRMFARHMVDDHSRANEQLAALARAQGIEAPTTPAAKQQKMVTRLKGLSGAAFDRAYVKEQVTAHRETVDLFETASHSNAADLQPYQAFIAQTLPTLHQHLRDAESLAGGPPVAQTAD